jgi:hypothetical protein
VIIKGLTMGVLSAITQIKANNTLVNAANASINAASAIVNAAKTSINAASIHVNATNASINAASIYTNAANTNINAASTHTNAAIASVKVDYRFGFEVKVVALFAINYYLKFKIKVMARKKRNSKKYEAAIVRKASMESIDPNLDLGNGLTLAVYQTQIDSTKKALDDYNTQLSNLDGLSNILKAEERKLGNLSQRMLNAVASKYSNDSDEYEKAGGTKKSEIKRTAKKSVSEKKG